MIPEGIGGELILTNLKLKKARFRAMGVENLILDNVEFTGETNFDSSQAKKFEVRKIIKNPSATVTAKGTNIRFY